MKNFLRLMKTSILYLTMPKMTGTRINASGLVLCKTCYTTSMLTALIVDLQDGGT